jgi:hypothetical protein
VILEIYAKDNRILKLYEIGGDTINEIIKTIKFHAFESKKPFAFYRTQPDDEINEFAGFNWLKEFARMGVDIESEKSPFKLFENPGFEISPTYPSVLVVPRAMSHQEVINCSKFRTKKRFPGILKNN